MLKLENTFPHKKIRTEKKKKRILTPAFLSFSPKSAKENNKPRIIKVEEIFGKVKVLPKKKNDEGESFFPWRFIPLDFLSKKTQLPKLSLNQENARKRRTTSLRWHLETEDEFLEKFQPLKRKEVAVHYPDNQRTGSQAESSTRKESTQTDKREKYPLHYTGDDK
ncbi:hypothetical protein PUN28_011849 [Cardiocondyla obscurior]|uniref:Uncharacterized protein n=1 Tax=Cardiocondyla obscurior TaxID=286306 RepID=A0AAW2FI68_9HYME